MFAQGMGIEPNLEEAGFRYLIASRMGNTKAHQLFSELWPRLFVEQQRRVIGRAEEWLRENAEDHRDPPRDTILGFG